MKVANNRRPLRRSASPSAATAQTIAATAAPGTRRRFGGILVVMVGVFVGIGQVGAQSGDISGQIGETPQVISIANDFDALVRLWVHQDPDQAFATTWASAAPQVYLPPRGYAVNVELPNTGADLVGFVQQVDEDGRYPVVRLRIGADHGGTHYRLSDRRLWTDDAGNVRSIAATHAQPGGVDGIVIDREFDDWNGVGPAGRYPVTYQAPVVAGRTRADDPQPFFSARGGTALDRLKFAQDAGNFYGFFSSHHTMAPGLMYLIHVFTDEIGPEGRAGMARNAATIEVPIGGPGGVVIMHRDRPSPGTPAAAAVGVYARSDFMVEVAIAKTPALQALIAAATRIEVSSAFEQGGLYEEFFYAAFAGEQLPWRAAADPSGN